MCNLYRMNKSMGEVAKWFDVVDETRGANLPAEFWPRTLGPVVTASAVHTMAWGFPYAPFNEKTGKPMALRPVQNARDDKLKGHFWRTSFEQRRCLIPVTSWAEAEGQRGSMTRTWLSLPDAELFAFGGVWQDSEEYGNCYSMATVKSVGPVARIHNRMPVVIRPELYGAWLTGTPGEAFDLCKPYTGEIAIEPTYELWKKGESAEETQPRLL